MGSSDSTAGDHDKRGNKERKNFKMKGSKRKPSLDEAASNDSQPLNGSGGHSVALQDGFRLQVSIHFSSYQSQWLLFVLRNMLEKLVIRAVQAYVILP